MRTVYTCRPGPSLIMPCVTRAVTDHDMCLYYSQWMVSEDSVYLPTRAVTNHARVRLLGAAILARRASILCMTTYR